MRFPGLSTHSGGISLWLSRILNRRWFCLFDPEGDINIIHERLRNDSILLNTLELKDASDEHIATRIIKRNIWEDLTSNETRMCIYFRPSKQSANIIITEEILQIDIHVPAIRDYLAYRGQSRVFALLNKYEVGNRKYYFEGMVGDLATMPGLYCVGSRYYFYTTK